jgi:hypothetical protein
MTGMKQDILQHNKELTLTCEKGNFVLETHEDIVCTTDNRNSYGKSDSCKTEHVLYKLLSYKP